MDSTLPSKDISLISDNNEKETDFVNMSSFEQSRNTMKPNPKYKQEQGVLKRMQERRATNPNRVKDLFSMQNNDSIISQNYESVEEHSTMRRDKT